MELDLVHEEAVAVEGLVVVVRAGAWAWVGPEQIPEEDQGQDREGVVQVQDQIS